MQGKLPDWMGQLLNEQLKFTGLSPIQELVVNYLQSDDSSRHVLARSHNGSGKTLALSLLMSDKLEQNDDVQVLIVTPTREISLQVNDFISLVLKAHPLALNSTLLIGGLPLKDQRKEMLVKKPQVIVGTMGRITEAIEKEYVKVEQIKLVIFDEADRFRVTDEQNVNFQNVKTLLEQVIQAQIAAFSATFSEMSLKKWKKALGNPVQLFSNTLDEKTSKSIPDHIQVFNVEIGELPANPSIEDYLQSKLSTLASILKSEENPEQEMEEGQILIFHNFKSQSAAIQRFVRHTCKRMSIVLNAEQTQEERISAFDKMRALSLKTIITTNLLARGVDLPDVRLVVSLDIPSAWEELVHRVGRAGRFGQKGLAFNLISGQADVQRLEEWRLQNNSNPVEKIYLDKATKMARDALYFTNEKVEQRTTNQESMLGQRKADETSLIGKTDIYKRQKLESKEAKIGNWCELDANIYDKQQFSYKDGEMAKEELVQMCRLLELPQTILNEEEEEEEEEEYESEEGESEISEKFLCNIPVDRKATCKAHEQVNQSEDFSQFRAKVLQALDEDPLFLQYAELVMSKEVKV